MQLTNRIRLFQTRKYLTYYKCSRQFVSPFILNMIIISGVDLAFFRTSKILQPQLHLLLHHLQVIQLQTTLQVLDLRHQRVIPHRVQTRLQNQQTITPGSDNSTCRSNPNPPPTQQNTTTNLVGDCNADGNDRSYLQQNINNNQGPDIGNENNNNGGG